MAVANFRFYEELNDFLPPRRRKCAFACVCARGATVKHAIEALGVLEAAFSGDVPGQIAMTGPPGLRRARTRSI